MKITIASPSVAPHIKQNVLAYYESGKLNKFYTSFIYKNHSKVFIKLFKKLNIHRELNRRSFDELPKKLIVNRPFPEIIRTLSSKFFNNKITDKIWEWSELGFDQWVSSRLKINNPNVIHTYEHAAYSTLLKAKELGIHCVYEQLSQHHKFFDLIIKQQLNHYPLLSNYDTEILINDKAIKRNKRRDQELAIADTIICNSSFTKKTLLLAGIPNHKIKVIPLAYPKTLNLNDLKIKNGKVKFLYAGNQSIRKGTHLLFEAWENGGFSEKNAELILVGRPDLNLLMGKALPKGIQVIQNIPHIELMELYKDVDIFVLPTLADGFGMVITEALSQGVPVITTENSCGPDIIVNGKNGWVIPANDTLALIEAINHALVTRSVHFEMGKFAIQKASEYQWSDYRKKLIETIEQSII